MKFVPKAERAEWHRKAIAEAKSSDLDSAIELLVATKEMDLLADLVSQASDQALVSLSHYTTEPVAKKLVKNRPDLAARLWRAQGAANRQRQEEQVLRRQAKARFRDRSRRTR